MLPYEDEDDLRAHLETFGELFDTGYAEKLRAEWFDEPGEGPVGQHVVRRRTKRIRCLTSDVTLHQLVKTSPVTRDADGTKYAVRDLVPDGVGLTSVFLTA